jgi:hypothetical protein
MAFVRSFLAVLALALSLATTSALQITKNGLIGAENTVLFLNGFHFISGAPDHFIQANHHCALANGTGFDAFIQCVIYVPGTNPARLAGIEYIVSGDAFETFSMEERQLWHSHQFEVSSGQLIEPGLPDTVDHEVMKILVNSYGKTFHTWRFDQQNNTIPLGIPELVYGFTAPGQLNGDLNEVRDEYYGVNTTEIMQSREDIPVPPIQAGADSWKDGFILTLGLNNVTGNTTFS